MLDGINKSNKDMFLQQLILEEVIVRREANIRAFSRGLKVQDMLSMITGYPHLIRPPMGVKFSIEILYHVNDDNVLPSASACTHKLFLPVCHCSEDAFFHHLTLR